MKRIFILMAVFAAAIGAYAQSAVITLPAGSTSLPLGNGTPVIVDFSATWCGACRSYEPTFEAVAKKFQGQATFYHVDVDDCSSLAGRYVERYVPSTFIFDAQGNVVYTFTGSCSEDTLTQYIQSYLHLTPGGGSGNSGSGSANVRDFLRKHVK